MLAKENRNVFIVPLITFLVALGLWACTTATNTTSNLTTNEQLAIAYGSVTQIRQTTVTLLQANKISVADAQNIQDGANAARAGLDVARDMQGKDVTGAVAKLEAAKSTINALLLYLSTKAGGT